MHIGWILLYVFFLQANETFAAEISHTAAITHATVDSEIDLDVSLSIQAANDTEYFLRGVFFKEGSTNYCGYTWNGDEYFAGPYSTNEQWKKFQKILIVDSKWEGKMKVKIDPSDSGCQESGEYLLKIQRFTSSGGSSYDTQQESEFVFTIPTQTPTPSNTPTPSKTPTPTKKPTATSAPKATSSTQGNTKVSDAENAALTSQLLAGKESYNEGNPAGDAHTPTRKTKKKTLGKSVEEIVFATSSAKEKDAKGGNIFIYLGGASMLTSCGILLYQTYRNKNEP